MYFVTYFIFHKSSRLLFNNLSAHIFNISQKISTDGRNGMMLSSQKETDVSLIRAWDDDAAKGNGEWNIVTEVSLVSWSRLPVTCSVFVLPTFHWSWKPTWCHTGNCAEARSEQRNDGHVDSHVAAALHSNVCGYRCCCNSNGMAHIQMATLRCLSADKGNLMISRP